MKRWSVHLIKLAAEADRWPSWTSKSFDKFMMFSLLNRLLLPSERNQRKSTKLQLLLIKTYINSLWSIVLQIKYRNVTTWRWQKWCSLMRYLIQWIPYFANSGLSLLGRLVRFYKCLKTLTWLCSHKALLIIFESWSIFFCFSTGQWVWIKVACIFIQPLSELVEAV